MSNSDPLGDMLTRIRNAQRARHSMCIAPASKLRANVLDVLKREGFIRGFARRNCGLASRSFVSSLVQRGRAGDQGDHPHLQAGSPRLF